MSAEEQSTQSEILAILHLDGPCHPSVVSRKTGIKVEECRWHLEKMRNRGEIGYSWTKGYSV